MQATELIALREKLDQRAVEESRSSDLLKALTQVSADLKQLLTVFATIQPPVVNVSPAQAPVVNVTTPDVRVEVSPTPVSVNVQPPVVNIAQPTKQKSIQLKRNDIGQIVGADIR